MPSQTNSERGRRHRQHLAGNHTECSKRFCPDASPPTPPPFEPPAVGSVTEAVIDYVAAEFEPGRDAGPIEVTIRLALAVAKSIDNEGPGLPALAGRLQELLGHLAGLSRRGEDSVLAEIQTRRIARRAGLAELAEQLEPMQQKEQN